MKRITWTLIQLEYIIDNCKALTDLIICQYLKKEKGELTPYFGVNINYDFEIDSPLANMTEIQLKDWIKELKQSQKPIDKEKQKENEESRKKLLEFKNKQIEKYRGEGWDLMFFKMQPMPPHFEAHFITKQLQTYELKIKQTNNQLQIQTKEIKTHEQDK